MEREGRRVERETHDQPMTHMHMHMYMHMCMCMCMHHTHMCMHMCMSLHVLLYPHGAQERGCTAVYGLCCWGGRAVGLSALLSV